MKIASGPANASPKTRGPSRVAVRSSECLQAIRITPHQQQVWNQPIAVAQRQPTLGGDRKQIGHVLGSAHAASGAVDYDADVSLAHSYPPVECEWSIEHPHLLQPTRHDQHLLYVADDSVASTTLNRTERHNG